MRLVLVTMRCTAPPTFSEASVVMISDVWGHYHSRVVDNFELISAWGELHRDLADDGTES